MLSILIKMFSDLTFFVGFIKNGAYPNPLNSEEEAFYVNKFLNENDKSARNKLIEHNLRLVVHIAKKYESNNDSLEDLISIGTIGLIKGVDTFTSEKGVKIATYTARCIENEILMHFRSSKKSNREISLADSIGQDKEGNDITLIEILPNNEMPLPEALEKKNLLCQLGKYLTILDERDAIIINYRYGLNNYPELTQKEVAKKFKISRSYVSRIEKRALIKLLYEFKKNNYI